MRGYQSELNEATGFARYADGKWQTVPGNLPEERMLKLLVNGQPLVSIMCTPEKLNCLIVGFLKTEGLIQSLDDIVTLRFNPDDFVADVELTFQPDLKGKRLIKNTGLGGGPSFDSGANIKPVDSSWRVSPAQIISSIGFLKQKDGSTRPGIHVSAITDGEKLISKAEDIGRHNTLDKLWGECLITGTRAADRLMVTSGRISSEMLMKAAKMGIPVVVSPKSVTSHAVKLGIRLGVTIVSYAEDGGLLVYSHPQRIHGFPTVEHIASCPNILSLV